MPKMLRLLWTAALLAAPAAPVAAAFAENFEVDPTAFWTVNGGPSDETANFFFDYCTVGIPLAPNSTTAGTRGLKLQANLSGNLFAGFSVSPTGESFTGDYLFTFDWWANFNGPFPAGGSGSANLSTFGIGTAGDVTQWPGGTQDSVWFGAVGDGNSSSDWRAYSTAGPGAIRTGARSTPPARRPAIGTNRIRTSPASAA